MEAQRAVNHQLEEQKNKSKNDKITLDPHFFLNPDDFKLDKNPIGSGGSAIVYKGTYKEIDVAVKRLNISL